MLHRLIIAIKRLFLNPIGRCELCGGAVWESYSAHMDRVHNGGLRVRDAK